ELSLEVADGELVALVGPSGCGKSTLLQLIAGLEAPTSGVVRIGGEVVNERSPGERDVAMVFQSYALYPHLDVRGNLEFPLKVAGLPRAERAKRVAETAARLGLEALLERKPSQLSGGQRQRVALGRALVRRPKVFLFDEPLSNLDAGLRAQTRAEIKKLHEELRATFIYVTHDQTEAMTLSDRVALMREGELQQVGGPRELYGAPRNLFVARFFGSPAINLAAPAVLGLGELAKGYPGRELLVGVRPEDLSVSRGAAPEGALGGSVYLVEPLGAESFVTVELTRAPGTRLVARAPASFEAGSGEAVWLRLDAARLHLFDAASGERLS
ncbi:MAG: ABC transporter ATP-binding protein, partial [Myxococcaceae bacterium]